MPRGCSNEEDCLSLSDGRWGRVVGVRVTHVAAGVWAGVLLAAAGLASGVAGEWRAGAMPAVLWNLVATGVLVASLAGVWFILLQAIVLRRWCLRCNLAHTAAFVGLLVVTILAPPGLPWPMLSLIAASLVGLLIALQVLFPPKQFAATPAPMMTNEVATEPVAPASPDLTLERQPPVVSSAQPTPPPSPPPSASPAVARLVGGRVALRLDQWPLFGSSGDTHVVALMMDYLCRDCLHVHRLLLQAVEQSQGTLAVLLLPVPMDPQTHPSLKPPKPPYDNPRAYARLAMALHQFSPEAFLSWDRHLVHADPMPLITDATAFAQTLVSPDDLTRSLTSPAIDSTLREAAMWFTTVGPMQVPKLLLAQSIITGRIPDLPALVQILEKEHMRAQRAPAVHSAPHAPATAQASRPARASSIWSDHRIR